MVLFKMFFAVSATSTTLAALAASVFLAKEHLDFFFRKNFIEFGNQNVKYLRVPSTAHQILECRLFGSENAGTKANTHVVVVHFVGLLFGDYMFL